MSKKKLTTAASNHIVPTKDIYYFLFFLFLIVLLYGRTLGFDFVLDDGLFILNNPVVQKGISGIPAAFSQGSMLHFKGGNFQIYRPLQISFFCLEKQFFGFTPGAFHFFNLVLYFLTSIIIYKLMRMAFPQWHKGFAMLITLLFIVHPIHTEVVANAKSQDELLSALFNLSALLFLFKALQHEKRNNAFYLLSVLLFLLGLFSKESSFAFIVIFSAALFLLLKKKAKDTVILSLPYFMAGLFFLICRHFAIKDVFTENETTVVENVLYGAKDFSMLWGTKLEILFYYLKMMVFPYPMTWDYSFNQIPLISLLSFVPLFSLLLYMLIGLLMVFNIYKRPSVSFGLFFFIVLIAPTSNLFFLNGATFADRFLFLPSLGFIMAIVSFLLTIVKNSNDSMKSKPGWLVYSTCALISCLFFFMTTHRNEDWKSDDAVFRSGALNAPNSSRTNAGMGTQYFNMAEAETDPMRRQIEVDSAIYFFKRSLDIFPDNSNASYKLGLIFSLLNNQQQSIYYYRKSIQSKPNNIQALNNIGAVYAGMNRFDSAAFFFKKAFDVDDINEMTLTNMCIAEYNIGHYQQSINYGDMAEKKGMGNKKVYNMLSLSWGAMGNPEKAKEYAGKASMSR